jgi:predicted RNA binding protein YcfA (HicA-like mRNA interferase family)
VSFSPEVWRQLRSITAKDILKALQRDGWKEEIRRGATRSFSKTTANGSGRRLRVVIHYHPKKTYGTKLLKGLLEETGWSLADLVRLKLVKKEAVAHQETKASK